MLERHFLGWDKSGLAAACTYLIERYAQGSQFDLAHVRIVLPGARAGRRFLEILVERAEEAGLGLTPPSIVTAGALAELIAPPLRPRAGKILRLLVWREVLQEAPDSIRELFLNQTPASGSLAGWLPWGEFFDKIFEELASGCLEVDGLLEQATHVEGFADGQRWQALGALRESFLARLDALGYEDPQAGRLQALAAGRCSSDDEIILVGMADLSLLVRRMLESLPQPTTALVLAPESHAQGFDEQGCIRPETWAHASLRVPARSIHVADSPSSQGALLLRVLESFGTSYAPEDIAIGTPDEEVIPYLEQALGRHDIASHRGDGHPLLGCGPARFLLRLEQHLRDHRFASFAELLRDPAVEQVVTSASSDTSPPRTEDWLGRLDAYRDTHLPYDLPQEWLDPGRNGTLEAVAARVNEFLSELRGPPRGLPQWATVILDTLFTAYDERPLYRDRTADRQQLELFGAVHAALVELSQVDSRVAPTVDAADALRLLLHHLSTRSIPDVGVDGAIDLLGWLEIPLDDRPALILTGFNDGRVPTAVVGDPLLPNSLRSALGLLDNARRHARDAYSLTLVLHSRRETHVILGRRSADGTPLLPSRLLLAVPRSELPERVELLFPDTLEEEGDPQRTDAEPVTWLPQPVAPSPRVEALSVTAFRRYLECPYGFYLEHILKLRAVEETVHELDALAFGNLAHDVLNAFGTGPVAGSEDADAIGRYLDRALARLMRVRFGKHPQPAVLIQMEQLRPKLRAFAVWQADWRRAGWKIEHTEVPVEPGLGTLLAGERHQVYLRGRLDRIDVHETTREFAVLDYKTSEGGATPEKTHRKQGRWIDLQLPLYRILARSLGTPEPIRLGYVVLPKDVDKVGVHLASWDEADLAEAEAFAGWVVDQIGDGSFWPPTHPPPQFSKFTRLYPMDRQPTAASLEEPAAG